MNAIPDVGQFTYGPDMGATIIANADLEAGDVTTDATSNFIAFDFGDLDDPGNSGETIDVLFTVRVNDQPFADQLALTIFGEESNSNSPGTPSIAAAVTNVTLQQPEITTITKGVVGVGTDVSGESYDNGTPTGLRAAGDTDANPLTTTVNSTNLASLNLDSNVEDVDAGDLVRFAIVVENTGSSAAGVFDITLSEEAIPAG